MNNIEARLQNTEKALMALVTVLIDLQPPIYHSDVDLIMNDFFYANSSLGFDAGIIHFLNSGSMQVES